MSKEDDEIDMQRLPCILTASEREAKNAELVRLELEEARQKADKKATVAGLNADLKHVRASIDQLAKELSDGSEEREVPVKHVYDYEAKRVRCVRQDTGDEISSREMDAMDLQENLPDPDLHPPPSKPQKRTRKKKHGELSDAPDQP